MAIARNRLGPTDSEQETTDLRLKRSEFLVQNLCTTGDSNLDSAQNAYGALGLQNGIGGPHAEQRKGDRLGSNTLNQHEYYYHLGGSSVATGTQPLRSLEGILATPHKLFTSPLPLDPGGGLQIGARAPNETGLWGATFRNHPSPEPQQTGLKLHTWQNAHAIWDWDRKTTDLDERARRTPMGTNLAPSLTLLLACKLTQQDTTIDWKCDEVSTVVAALTPINNGIFFNSDKPTSPKFSTE
ncbi:hypothetical protein AAG570_001515 [Ranatra chinensis]|uniref:Uncharacterized protein n=1 Tax=Ranatra chinensis TaxID=642074 RepID=A0ABD0YMT5_9HEMI